MDEMNRNDAPELDNVIVLSDDDGNELEFELVDTAEYNGKEFVLLLPTDEESEEVVILQTEADPDNEEMVNFVTIEDESLLEEVYSIFKDKLQDEFDFA